MKADRRKTNFDIMRSAKDLTYYCGRCGTEIYWRKLIIYCEKCKRSIKPRELVDAQTAAMVDYLSVK